MKNLLIAECDHFPEEALQRLSRAMKVHTCQNTRDSLEARLAEADVLWVRLRHFIDEAVMDRAPRCKAIVSATTGLNHIDMRAASRHGITVLSLRGATNFLRHVHATAELALGLMLALMRHIPAAVNHVVEGGWNRDLFRGNELTGRTVGIIGYGRLGRAVGHLLAPFHCRILAADRPNAPIFPAPGVELVPLDHLLADSEVITLHVSLSRETERMIDSRLLQRMRNGTWLVNTARGELVDEEALLRALDCGKLAGAALDVLTGEQSLDLAANPVIAYARSHANLILTPHIGGCTAESMSKAETYMAERLLEWLARSEPSAAIPEAHLAHQV